MASHLSEKNAVVATPSKPLVRARSTKPHRCATSTPGLIHESCRRRKVSKHKEMPQIAFSDEDVYAILSYLYALSVSK